MIHHFDHERLDAYKLSIEVARWIRIQQWPTGDSGLKDQAWRASASVPLNIAGGRSRGGRAMQNHYRIARGSAAEVTAILDVVSLPGGGEQQQKLRRVGAMLTKMMR